MSILIIASEFWLWNPGALHGESGIEAGAQKGHEADCKVKALSGS